MAKRAIVPIGRVGSREIQNVPEEREHQAELNQKPEIIRDLKVDRLETFGEEIIDGERGGDQRTPAAVRGQGAESIGVFEDERNVAQIADIGVGGDGVEVVEMEIVVEVIAVRDASPARVWRTMAAKPGGSEGASGQLTDFGLCVKMKAR